MKAFPRSRFLSILLIVTLVLFVFPAPAFAQGGEPPPATSLLEKLALVAGVLAEAAFLVTITNRLVAGLITPFFDKFKWDKFYLLYVAWILGGGIVFIFGINLFSPFNVDPLIGKVFSAIVSGGGANLLHDLFDKPAGPTYELATLEAIDSGPEG